MKHIQEFEMSSEYLPEQYSFIHVADNFCFEGVFLLNGTDALWSVYIVSTKAKF